MRYQRFLEAVMEQVPDYGDIKDVISRYDTLMNTHNELLERSRRIQEELENRRTLSEQLAEVIPSMHSFLEISNCHFEFV
jgi:hypothetical protein